MRKRVVLVAVVFLSVAVYSMAQSPFEIDGVRYGLVRSPEDFVACVFEPVGPIQCGSWGDEGEELCWVPVRVLDEIASRPSTKSPRLRLKIAAHGEPGQILTGRGIAFLIPIKGTDVYHESFGTIYGKTKHERFRHLVEAAIAGTRSI